MRLMQDFYKNLSLPTKAALWFAFAQFFQKAVSMITTPVFTRILSTQEFGRINTFLSWAEILIIIITLSVWRGILNLYKNNEDKDRILSSVLLLTVIIAMIFVVFLVIFHKILLEITNMSMALYVYLVLYAISQNIIFAWTLRMQYDYKYKPIITFTILYSAVTAFGGVLLVLIIDRNAEARLFPQICFITLFAIIIVAYYLKKGGKIIWDKKTFIFCISFSVPLIPHYLSEVVLHSSDRIMIDKLCGTSDVAIYSIAYAVGSLILMITSAVNSAFAPYQYQKINRKEYKELSKTTNAIIFFIVVCACMLMLFGKEIVLIFGGEKYYDSIPLIIPITVGVVFNYVFQLFARVQEFYEQKHTIVIASSSCALLNVLLNYIYIQKYGYVAAAYTTAICYVFFCVLHYLFYRQACKKNIGREIYEIKSLVIIMISFVGASLFISMINQFFYLKYVILLILMLLAYVKRKWIINMAKNIWRR